VLQTVGTARQPTSSHQHKSPIAAVIYDACGHPDIVPVDGDLLNRAALHLVVSAPQRFCCGACQGTRRVSFPLLELH